MFGQLYAARARRELERRRLQAWEKQNRAIVSDEAACTVCKAIADVLDAPWGLRVEIPLGELAELKRLDCADHNALFPSTAFEANDTSKIILRKPAQQSLIYLVPDLYRFAPKRALLEAPWEPTVPREHINDAKPAQDALVIPSRIDLEPQPRRIDRSYIDISLLNNWLFTCQKDHEAKCGATEFPYTSEVRPSLLVDVLDKCLVEGGIFDREYVALSYVWGGTNQFFTSIRNRDSLTTVGSLGDIRGIPRTVREAITLTKSLGKQYLWVDALCIVQDHDNQDQELNNMSSIFANACLTIVHADGQDASSGFRGLLNISEKRDANQRVIHVASQERKMIKPTSRQVWSSPMLAPWSNRAWTFQEEVCSRRLMYFAHDSVRWACRSCRWSEESEAADCMATYASAEQLRLSLDSPTFSHSNLPQLSELQALVNGFNTRELTFPEDALLAFAGVAMRLGSKFVGGFISGLPEQFFDICLLWRPQRRKGVPIKRVPSRQRLPGHKGQSSVLPSWSWAGWDTEVMWPFTWNCTSEIAAPFPAMVGDNKPFYNINIRYLDFRGNDVPINHFWAAHASSTLSEGRKSLIEWKERDCVVEYREEKKSYVHASDSEVGFWFPIAVCDTPSAPRNIRLISFKTTTVYFQLGSSKNVTTTILAPDGTIVGTLWHHDKQDPIYIDAISTGTYIQLVAILGCVVPKDYYMSMLGSPDFNAYAPQANAELSRPPSRRQEVYAVLWIQWDDERKVACRKGTGQVAREAWDTYTDDRLIEVLLE